MILKAAKKTHVAGFSAIEVVIVIGISALVALALSNIYVTFFQSYTYQNASINTSISATLFVNEMNDIALQADAVLASRAFSGTTYTTGSTTVVFEIPSINSSGDILSNTYDYAVLYSTSTKIYRIMDANASSARTDSSKMFTDVLSNLTLTYDTGTPSQATRITIDVTTATSSRGKTPTTRLKQTVYLRNK